MRVCKQSIICRFSSKVSSRWGTRWWAQRIICGAPHSLFFSSCFWRINLLRSVKTSIIHGDADHQQFLNPSRAFTYFKIPQIFIPCMMFRHVNLSFTNPKRMAKSRLVEVAFCNRRRIVVADLLDFCLVFFLVGVFCVFYINQLQCMAAGKFDWPQSPLVVLSSVPELATLKAHASELQVPTKKTKPKSFFHVSTHRGTHSPHLCSFPSLPHRYFLNSNNQAVDCLLGSAATHTSSIWVHNWVCCFLWVVDYILLTVCRKL